MSRAVAGVTLIELLVVLAILAVLLGVAVPGLRPLLDAQAGVATMQTLQRLLTLARSGAVSAGSVVTFCASRNASACGGTWRDGVLVFVDHDGDRRVDAADLVLRYHAAPLLGGEVALRSFPARQYVQFTPLGFTNNQNGTFTWCPASRDAHQAQQLIFTKSGRTRLAQDRNADGIREGSNGRPLTCG